MGVFAQDITDLLAHVLKALGTKSALVVSGYGGLDELTTSGPNTISHLREDGTVTTYELDPLTLGFEGSSVSELKGGDAATNAKILRGILSGEIRDAKRDVVLLNAGAALVAAGLADNIPAGIVKATDVIDSGAALAKLEALIQCSNQQV
jgi:anthranilate phosphoribosyltransferase